MQPVSRGIYVVKKCIQCSNELTSRKQQKFCSNKCQMNYQYESYIEKWLRDEISGERYEGEVSNHVRRWLFEKFNYCCSKCSWSEIHPITKLIPLQVNHINGDWSHHRPDNLELLCPNCHALTPNYGSLNNGKGRRIRSQKLGGAWESQTPDSTVQG